MESVQSGEAVSAAVLVIGDEILSGRTQDTNLAYLAKFLAAWASICAKRAWFPISKSRSWPP